MLVLLMKGLVMGFAIAAPVGPIGILCVQRSLHNGFKIGLMTGLGAATADGIYGIIVGFGLTSISHLLINYQLWIKLFGALILCYFGIKILITASRHQNQKISKEKSWWHAYSSTMLLTLFNPLTILFFLAAFTTLGLGGTYHYGNQAIALVAGIIAGSVLWWLILSGSVSFILHHRLNTKALTLINISSGLVILAFAVAAFCSGVFSIS